MLAGFYTELLGFPVTYRSPDWVVVAENDTTSGLAFQLARDHEAPQWPDPAHPQQIHFDVMTEDVAEAATRILALGARHLSGSVYADPAGHPFCLIRRPGWAAPIPSDRPAVPGAIRGHTRRVPRCSTTHQKGATLRKGCFLLPLSQLATAFGSVTPFGMCRQTLNWVHVQSPRIDRRPVHAWPTANWLLRPASEPNRGVRLRGL